MAPPDQPSLALAGEPSLRIVAPEPGAISEALRSSAREGIAQGWSEVRDVEIPQATLEELLLRYEWLLRNERLRQTPRELGRHAAEEANARDARWSALGLGDARTWLELEPDAGELAAVAVDPERFAALFQPRSRGPAVEPSTLAEGGALADGSVIAYPAGVFRVRELTRLLPPFPADLTVRGAGMDATLLVLDTIRTSSGIERLAVEDCTLFVEPMLDVRGRASVFALRRVRIVGFDCGGGVSHALEVDAAAVWASQCRFEGGYGSEPEGHAKLIRSLGPLVARFDACTFERMILHSANRPGIAFTDCVMTDLFDEPSQSSSLHTTSEGLYLNCRITLVPPEQRHDRDVLSRDLNDLFPGWQERL